MRNVNQMITPQLLPSYACGHEEKEVAGYMLALYICSVFRVVYNLEPLVKHRRHIVRF